MNAVGGNDQIILSPVNGPVTESATLNGGLGSDVMSGGAGYDILNGGPGNDTSFWGPGEDNGFVEGGDGTDVLEISGSSDSDGFNVEPNGAAVRVTRDAALGILGVGTTEFLRINAGPSNDVVLAISGNRAETFEIAVNGGEIRFTRNIDSITMDLVDVDSLTVFGFGGADDFLEGGAGVDIIDGRAGNDQIAPGPGNDTSVLSGPGNDIFSWFDIDGADVLDAELGVDTFVYSGSGTGENVTIDASLGLGRVRVVHGGLLVIELRNFEAVTVSTLEGGDNVLVGPNLTGLVTLRIELGAGNDALSTAASSTVVANGGDGSDTLTFNTLGQPISTTATTLAAGGVTRVTHRNVEQIVLSNVIDQPPLITVVTPTTAPATTATTPFILLEGTAGDAIGLASVSWVNNRGGSGTARPTRRRPSASSRRAVRR